MDDAGRIERIELPALSYEHLQRLASLIAYETHQVVDETRPLLSAWLPTGQRVQIVMPRQHLPVRVFLQSRNLA